MTTKNKHKIFISYSHKDEKWKNEVIKHLEVLYKENLIPDTWDDHRISAGDRWYEEIAAAMDNAQAAVFLVSVDFLNSDFIRNEEIPRLIKRRNEEGMPLFPLILRPCSWQKNKLLAPIQARPDNGRPLLEGSDMQIEKDLTAFAEEIAEIIKNKDSTLSEPLKQKQFRNEMADLYRLRGCKIIERPDECLEVKESLSGSLRTTTTLVGCHSSDKWVNVGLLKDFALKFSHAVIKREAQFATFITDLGFDEETRMLAKEDDIELLTVYDLLNSLVDFTPYFEQFTQEMEEQDQTRLLQTYVDLTYSRLDVVKTLEAARNPHMPYEKGRGDEVEIDLKTGHWDGTDEVIDSYVDQWLFNDEHYHISILGDFGAGKTSFCKQYTYKLIKHHHHDPTTRIPLFIPLKHFSSLEGEVSVRVIVTHYLVNEYKVQTNYETLERLIRAGKILFLLDGYDEMAMKVDPSTRKKNFDVLAELAKVPRNKVILTGRPGYFPKLTEVAKTFGHQLPASDPYDEMDEHLDTIISGQPQPVYEIVKLNLFTPEQIDLFLHKQSHRLKEAGVSDWERLKEAITTLPGLEELSQRPVLLWMIVEGLPKLLKRIKEIKDINLARIYQSFTDKWLERDWKKGKFRRLIKKEDRRDFMKELAFEMYQSKGAYQIHYDELKERVKSWKAFEIKKDIELEYIEHDIRTCTFLHHDEKDGDFKFIHKSFMEYFVAEKLSQSLLDGTCEEIQINDAIRSFIYSLINGKWKPELFTGSLPDWLEKREGRFFAKSDGKEMVYIPPGPFIMGGEDNTRIVRVDEGFFLDRHPVTNKEYAQFIEAGGYENKEYWSEEGWKFIKNEGYTEPRLWRNEKWNGSEQPVVGVSWYEADAYARWAEKQLPIEEKWEKAARGRDGRTYPWGDELPDENLCNFDNKVGKTTLVGHYKAGKSPYGAYDMAGNIWEWCENLYNDDMIYRVIRGGSHWNDKDAVRSFRRGNISIPNRRGNSRGFRCART